jgi:hypothetical protein
MSTCTLVSQGQNGFPLPESTFTPPSSLLPQRVHDTLTISHAQCANELFWYWSVWGKAYLWRGMWQVKRSSIIKPTPAQSLNDSNGDTMPRLSSRISHPPGLVLYFINPKNGTCQRYSFPMLNPSWSWWINHHNFYLEIFTLQCETSPF